MHTAMLWFDNSKTDLRIKIEAAVDHYIRKYGRSPDLVLVHPVLVLQDVPAAHAYKAEPVELDFPGKAKVTVRPYRPVLPGHLWIGIEDTQPPKGTP
jgi:hypothetical protein